MKLSSTTSSLFATFGEEDGIKVAKEVGFDALDLNLILPTPPLYEKDGFLKYADRLRNAAEKAGMPFNQAHAPFPTMKFKNGDTAKPDEEYNAITRKRIEDAILCAGRIGAEQIVIHPVDFLGRADAKERNIEIYRSFAPIAEEAGVKIALENMWGYRPGTRHIVPNVCSTGEELGAYYDALPSSRFSVCLDLGHSELVNETAEAAILALGHDRLHALHVHDNDSMTDGHTIPYFGVMNWERITKALADIDYGGDFTFEVNGAAFQRLEKEPKTAYFAYALLAQTGKTLIEKIEKYKEKRQ